MWSGNPDLRREFDAATAIREPDRYLARLEELRAQFDHSVRVLAEGKDTLRRFNCFAYATGIWSDKRYADLVEEMQDSAIMNSDFAARVFAGLNDLPQQDIDLGDIVMYFKDGRLKHAGRVARLGDIPVIHSKWGPSEVHEHFPWHVPVIYGDRLTFCRLKDTGRVVDLLHRFAREGEAAFRPKGSR